VSTDRLETAVGRQQLSADTSLRVRIGRWLLLRLAEVLFFKTTWRTKVQGQANVPATGPAIVCFNHVTIFDPMAAGWSVSFKRSLAPLAKEELARNPLTAWVVWAWHAIPVKRGEVDRAALKRAFQVIDSGEFLLISPEGHRQKEGLRDPKEGIIMLATRTKSTIVPIGVSGTEHFLRNLKRLRRTSVDVNIGRPFRIKDGVHRKQYAQAADEIMYQIAALLPPGLRGEYADLSKATTEMLDFQ
jgi:1-acyl-sn-glycerol-3-phosphate acyltransferase